MSNLRLPQVLHPRERVCSAQPSEVHTALESVECKSNTFADDPRSMQTVCHVSFSLARIVICESFFQSLPSSHFSILRSADEAKRVMFTSLRRCFARGSKVTVLLEIMDCALTLQIVH